MASRSWKFDIWSYMKIMPLRAHMHTHEIFHHYEPYDLDKCPPHEFLGMYSWPNKHIA